MYRHRREGKRGFTLIELIIVIVVLGILAGIAIAGYTAVIRRSNISSVEQSATSFNRQLISMAAQRTESGFQTGTEFDKSTRIGDILEEAVKAGDCPKGVWVQTIGYDGTSDNVVVTICDPENPYDPSTNTWPSNPRHPDGAGTLTAGALTFTRADATTEASGAGNHVVRYPAYLQFIKNGASVCLRLSDNSLRADDTANTPTGQVATPSDSNTGSGWIVMRKVASGSQAGGDASNACNTVATLGYIGDDATAEADDVRRSSSSRQPSAADWDASLIGTTLDNAGVMQGW